MTITTATAAASSFALTVQYPESWYQAASVVPWLRSPHELCAISSRPLQQVPSDSEQNFPMVQALDASGYLIWICYQVFEDPTIDDPQHPLIPNYSRFSYPFVYSEAELFPPQLDYEWNRGLLWRRVGLNLSASLERPEEAALTVMFWEGSGASSFDVQSAEAIVESVSVSAGALI